MQQCPLAGSNCGLMVRAKPWEASEMAKQSLLGHGPVRVGLAPAPDPLPLSGGPESEWQRLVLGVLFQQDSRQPRWQKMSLLFLYLPFSVQRW